MTDTKEGDLQYKSEVSADLHETARDLRDLKLISKRTMAEFDELCLTPIKPMSPEDIREPGSFCASPECFARSR